MSACFVAYFAARRNLRRQFTLSGKTNPVDQVADMLYRRCVASPATDWWMVSRVHSVPDVVRRLSVEDQGQLTGRWSALMRGAAEISASVWDPTIDRRKMIVRRGMDSSTWNTIAQAYNIARAGWLSAVATLGAEQLLDLACPGKVMRLMAADLAYWHRSAGGDVDPDTAVWAELPLPWKVLSERASCTRSSVAIACAQFGVMAEDRGWAAPRRPARVAEFSPTPELAHGVSIADPAWAALLRSAGVFSGKRIKPGYVVEFASGVPRDVVRARWPVGQRRRLSPRRSTRDAEDEMSDLRIRLIPTDPDWQPTAEAAVGAVEYVAGIFAGPGDHVEAVQSAFYERITLIDGGEYMQDVFCPRCDAAIGLDWFWNLLIYRNHGRTVGEPAIDDLGVIVPCCVTPLTLPELRFEAPVGFARFEVSAMNWARSVREFSDEELTKAGDILGHPVTQIHTHY